jgi:hypothetical protein
LMIIVASDSPEGCPTHHSTGRCAIKPRIPGEFTCSPE